VHCTHQSTGLLKERLVPRIDPKGKTRKVTKSCFCATKMRRTMSVEVEEKFGVVCLSQQIEFQLPRIPVHQTLCSCAVQFLKPPLLSVHRPRTAQIGKTKMVSSSSQTVPRMCAERCIFIGYRPQDTPRQEGPADGPQKRGSLPPFARESMYIQSVQKLDLNVLQLYRFLARRTDSDFNKVHQI